MKQQLSEAYEGEHCNECGRSYGDTVYSVPDSIWVLIHERAPAGLLCPTCALDRLARLVERLLPGECPHGSPEPHKTAYGSDERYCSGQVWDEGIVEAVAKAVKTEGGLHNHRIDRTVSGMDWPDSFYEDIARAVLSAIAQLVEGGEPELPPKDPWDYDP